MTDPTNDRSKAPRRFVVDLDVAELSRLASEAFANAGIEAWRSGFQVPGWREGKVVYDRPDHVASAYLLAQRAIVQAV